MERKEIIQQLSKFFKVEELVCDHTYAKWGEKSWQFIDTDLLRVLLALRTDILKRPLICNKKQAHQRGLRCNQCQLVKEKKAVYLSSHILGKAVDLDVQNMTAEQARQLILANADKLPCNVRLEGNVSWLHIDVLPQWNISDKVYIFTA